MTYSDDLLKERYAAEGETVWEDVFWRVATAVAGDNDQLALEFFNGMSSGAWMPSSPQLWNYGTNRRYSRNGSSCFTLDMGDDLSSFRKADSDAEKIYVASGGAGILLDSVRPRGTFIKHCTEGAMGAMCYGGPARRIEGTTGYITGSGRARGALMMQMGLHHPDVIEFITAKIPTSLGFLDDWRANAIAVLNSSGMEPDTDMKLAIERFYEWSKTKEWPRLEDVYYVIPRHVVDKMFYAGIVRDTGGRVVPVVTDWNTMTTREASRNWSLPLQNCNMSVRASHEFMRSVLEDRPWVLYWFDYGKSDDLPHTKTDFFGKLSDVRDHRLYVDEASGQVSTTPPENAREYRYGVVITTWEGLRDNLSPNKNMWRDTEYARTYREDILPAIAGFSGQIKAKQIWELVCRMAHQHADPGVVFSGTYEDFNPVDSDEYGYRLSNPCSEFVNPPGGSCDLTSINLRRAASMALSSSGKKYSKDFTATTVEDYKKIIDTEMFSLYEKHVYDAARSAAKYIMTAMEYNVAPVEYIHELSKKHFRTVGVGHMGLAEAMLYFHVKYGSEASFSFAAHTQAIIYLAAWDVSFELAREGAAKPKAWDQKRMTRIFKSRVDAAWRYGLPHRIIDALSQLERRVRRGEYASHTCVTSVAPTGSISMIVSWVTGDSTTSGCEPVFSWYTSRQDSNGQLVTTHDMALEYGASGCGVTANDVTPAGHIGVQAAVCAMTCMSVSKTVNLPESSTVQDISDAYVTAWRLGVPGTSVYRDRSKPMQVLSALDCPGGDCAIKPS